MNILEDLNEAQQAAVSYTTGPNIVVAGAGSGKTRVLTYKIAYLLQCGVSASNILVLTFTNKAAREMRERINKLVGEKYARYLWMGTFHSVFSKILRQEADRIGYTHDYTIYDSADSKSLIKGLLKELELDEKVYKPSNVLARISTAKNSMISPIEYARNKDFTQNDNASRLYRMSDLYYLYQQRLRRANAMDFDDLLYNMNIMLDTCEDLRAKYQSIFKYILVDEYQDTNYSQSRIVTALAEPENNICVVGDDAQSIYAFRGATIENILRFSDRYPGSRLFKLEQNYRSTQNIVNAANSLIHHNIGQIPKNVYSKKDIGDPLSIYALENDRDEASLLARQIKKAGRSYSDFAVLYRTNAQSRVIEDEMRKQSIPYKIYGSVSFYQRKEIKDAVSYFRLVVNSFDDEAMLRVVNTPARGIGDTTMRKVLDTAHKYEVSAFEVATNPQKYSLNASTATCNKLQSFVRLIQGFQSKTGDMDAYEFAKAVLRDSGMMTAAMLDTTSEGQDRYENLQELLNSIHEFTEAGAPERVPITDFLAEVSLLTDQDEKIDDDTPRVSLMTVHAAKGLEFPIVYIVGMEEKLFPSAFAESERDIEEERRLFYVAITRAEEQCHITYARQRFRNGQITFSTVSRFIKDIDGQYVRNQEAADIPQRSMDFGFDFFSRNSSMISREKQNLTSLSSVPSPKRDITSPYPIGSRVMHATFGSGVVMSAYEENGNEKISIRFDRVGEKVLLLKYAKLQRI